MAGTFITPEGCNIPVLGDTSLDNHHITIVNGELVGVVGIPSSGVTSIDVVANFGDYTIAPEAQDSPTNAFLENPANLTVGGLDYQLLDWNTFTLAPEWYREKTEGGWSLEPLSNTTDDVHTWRGVPEGTYQIMGRMATSPEVGTASADFNVLGFTADDDTTGVIIGDGGSASGTFALPASPQPNDEPAREPNVTLNGAPWDFNFLFTIPAGLTGGFTIVMSNLLVNGSPHVTGEHVRINEVILTRVS